MALVPDKTWGDVINEARVLLQDTDASSYRYSDATLLAIYNRGLQALARVRPDAFYAKYDSNYNVKGILQLVDYADTAGNYQDNLSDTFDIEMQFFAPLVSYIVGIVEIIDDEYSEDGRAALMLQSFKHELIGL